jgi:hypothetical protein
MGNAESISRKGGRSGIFGDDVFSCCNSAVTHECVPTVKSAALPQNFVSLERRSNHLSTNNSLDHTQIDYRAQYDYVRPDGGRIEARISSKWRESDEFDQPLNQGQELKSPTIPPGFCSFSRNFSGVQHATRNLHDMHRAQHIVTYQCNDFCSQELDDPRRGNSALDVPGVLLSDEEIWNEYRREKDRQQRELRCLVSIVNHFSFTSLI